MAKEKQKRFLLRMDEDLFQRLSAAADADGRSINAYIVHLLSRSAPTGNWEQRQLIGRSLAGKELDPDSGLVLVAGIYYRYLLESPEAPDPNASYTITESHGNILTLKKSKGTIRMFGIRIVRQNNEGLVETLGKYKRSVSSGIHFYLPGVQKIRTVNLAMTPLALPHYSVITKDNADVSASLTLNYHVTNSVKYQYENTDSVESMAQLVRGHLRDIIGRMDLNEALGSTAKINQELATAIGDLTDTYGINVDRTNIDELTPSKAIQSAMDKQLTADRERIAAIAKAEGEAKSIELTTKAKNDALMATASAEATATRTRADAEKYRIDTVNSSLETATREFFENQSISAFSDLAKSPANVVVVPNDHVTDLGQIPAIGAALKSGLAPHPTKPVDPQS